MQTWLALWVTTEAKVRIIINTFISILQCPFGSQTVVFQLIQSLLPYEAALSTLWRDGYFVPGLCCPVQPLFNRGRINPGEKRQDPSKGSAEREVEMWSKASVKTLKQRESGWVSGAARATQLWEEGLFVSAGLILCLCFIHSINCFAIVENADSRWKMLNYFTKVTTLFSSFFNDNWSIVPIFSPNLKIYFPSCYTFLSIFL